MSMEQAKAFIERMKTDDAFREKIVAIETLEGRLTAIKDAGFNCTAKEINEAGDDFGDFGECSGGKCKYAPPCSLDLIRDGLCHSLGWH